ncbi:lysophospholipid acyltransferase family protein [Flindersiella endophytica]
MSNPPKGAAYRFAEIVALPLLTLITRRDWRGQEHIPASGGVVIVTNHLSHIDPFVIGHFINNQGRPARFLAKASLFTVPVVGPFLRSAGQIPVHRERRAAGDALVEAVQAIDDGEAVLVYPEGTITRDPDQWPMIGKSGAVRIALRTGAPLVPVAQWGAQELLRPYAKLPRILPRKKMQVLAGPPVDLSAYHDQEITPALVKKATTQVMHTLSALVGQLRGGQAPAEPFDPVKYGLPATGNPYKKRKAR